MKIMGFRWKRYVEWKEVLVEEKKSASLLSLLAKMLWVFIKGIPNLKENRRTWRHKMRTCRACPIFDRGMKRCGPYTGSPLGCKCYTPLLAVFKRHCWATENLPNDSGLGW